MVKHIQPRKHDAARDSFQFIKIMRVVSLNLLISTAVLSASWLILLCTKIEADHPLTLPRSCVPLLQLILWYFCNDLFYFYPHWISHSIPDDYAFYCNLLPNKHIARRLPGLLRQAHKIHHRTKVNLGAAAWYSPWKQVLSNLFSALTGPLVTQVTADAAGVEDIRGTKLVKLYVCITASAVSSVLAHTNYRSVWNDPGKHDLHHERASILRRLATSVPWASSTGSTGRRAPFRRRILQRGRCSGIGRLPCRRRVGDWVSNSLRSRWQL